MVESKTKPTGASIEDYLASRANAQQQAEGQDLMALLRRVTAEDPVRWGPSTVGSLDEVRRRYG